MSRISEKVAARRVVQAAAAASRTRLQRRIALTVIVVPFLGTVLAASIAWQRGIGYVEVVSFGVMYLATMVGVSLGFHRLFTHKSYQTGPRTKWTLAVLGSMAAQGPLLFWAAMHRRHHAFSDRPGDPHSPHRQGDDEVSGLRGLWHAHIGWMLSEDTADWMSFARDLMQDRTAFHIHQTYFFWLGAGLLAPPLVAGLITWDLSSAGLAFLWGGLVRAFVVNQAAWCVGSVCHYVGSRPFVTHDHSANNYTVALFTFGEGLQNNHHAFPGSARHGMVWWEPDFSGLLIQGLRLLGIVWNVHHPTPEAIARLRRG